MINKIRTYFSATVTCARRLLFWSPGSYRNTQDFVRHINGLEYMRHTANPLLQEATLFDLIGRINFSEVSIAEFENIMGGVDMEELLMLCLLVRNRKPAVIFEIGTFEGITTLNLALNAPETTRVYTLDLPADGRTAFSISDYDTTLVPVTARTDLWQKHGVADRIEQIFCDSAFFDSVAFAGSVDLVFIDGSHTYDYVKNDTELALRMVSPKGIVVWHDFSPSKRGVFLTLNEIAGRIPIMHLVGTNLAFHDHQFVVVE